MGDIIVVAVMALCLAGILYYHIQKKKKGGAGCGCGCSGCTSQCEHKENL